MIICYHGAGTAARATRIMEQGFLAGSHFARHLEDALAFGGRFVFEVAFDATPLTGNSSNRSASRPTASFLSASIRSPAIAKTASCAGKSPNPTAPPFSSNLKVANEASIINRAYGGLFCREPPMDRQAAVNKQRIRATVDSPARRGLIQCHILSRTR
jgi:hypothetical protein